MKLKFNSVNSMMVVVGVVFMTATTLQAQTQTAPRAKGTTIAMAAARKAAPVRRETLSGIDLFPKAKNNDEFLLSFQQNMTEAGVLEFTNASGKVLFSKPISVGDHTLAAPDTLGKLKPGIYMVEVKTPTTVYWKKMRVRLR
ncbi:hypothetical protein [Rufibacter sp. LB8]|uniref:hypothetical protein n=1 Tax=Rufibacter sp. LB8 TaxID=2777781 RepID=UPI00178C4D42|nr:hypothetical protein [Rufibacter sp. LB8]